MNWRAVLAGHGPPVGWSRQGPGPLFRDPEKEKGKNPHMHCLCKLQALLQHACKPWLESWCTRDTREYSRVVSLHGSMGKHSVQPACMHVCEGPAGGFPSPQILPVIVNNSLVVSLRACVVQSIKQSTNILITCLFIYILYVIISSIWSHHFRTEFLFSSLLLSHFFHLHTSIWCASFYTSLASP